MSRDERECEPYMGMVRVNTATSHPGARLFDSDIAHQHYVVLEISHADRNRELNREWIHARNEIVEINLSHAQWGALVSSFGSSGVPCTIAAINNGRVPSPPRADRTGLEKSANEVRDAANRQLGDLDAAITALNDAIEANAGKRRVVEAMRNVKIVRGNLPSNLEFAATSLTEHVENVVTKAKADIEAMVDDRARSLGIDPGVVLRGLAPLGSPVAALPEVAS